MKFTIGSDPEFFLILNDNPKCATTYFPDKDAAIYEHKNQFYQENGYLEANIAPGRSLEEFKYNIYNALFTIKNQAYPKDISTKCYYEFPKQELLQPTYQVNDQYCIYTNGKIDCNKTTNERTCAGHIHLGFDEIPAYDKIVKLLDLFLAIPFVLIEKDNEATKRRKLHGFAGTYRYPLHGIEYCSLSNYWLFSPSLVDLVYDLCDYTLNFIENGFYDLMWNQDRCFGYNLNKLIEAINDNNKSIANKFYMLIQNYLPETIVLKIEKAIQKENINIYEEWKM